MKGSAVAGVILAAGPSRRFGGRPKPLLRYRGRPLVQRAVAAAAASRLADLYVVVGYEAERVASVLAGFPVSVVESPEWERGQSASVRAGLAALPATAEAALFLPVDQPRMTPAVLDRLVAAWEETGGPIVVPVFAGRRGSPVIIARALFDELAAITGDEGGRQLFASHPDGIVEVELDHGEPLADVDTPEEYERLTDDDGPPEPG